MKIKWCFKWTLRTASVITFCVTVIILLVNVNGSGKENDENTLFAIISILFVFSMIAIFTDLLIKRLWVPKIIAVENQSYFETPSNVPGTLGTSSTIPNVLVKPISGSMDSVPYLNFPSENLNLAQTIGEGQFGKVVMGEAKDLLVVGITSIVAVKMLKDNYTDSDAKDLYSEMDVMKSVGKHENIVNLLGCCYQDGKLLVIVDYALHGNLKSYLQKHSPTPVNDAKNKNEKNFKILSQQDLLSIAWQIAKGMEFLASKKCVHRDLAARNVLISGDFTMKISDFGLSRNIEDKNYYRKETDDGLLPFKWMAPESWNDCFYDSQNDVWSYGILLWEIMSFGASPYPGFDFSMLSDRLEKGYRMKKPVYCSDYMYVLMKDCWNYDPAQRPQFSKIVELLSFFIRSTNP